MRTSRASAALAIGFALVFACKDDEQDETVAEANLPDCHFRRSGSCDPDHDRKCSFAELCPPGSFGRVNGVQCACRDDEWHCAVTSPGAGICISDSPAIDAGSD